MTTTVQQRVKAGIDLLNEKYPGWKDEVVLKHLDMASQQDGLLEQLYGRYDEGLAALGLTIHEGYTHGFDIKVVGNDEEQNHSWQRLTDAWKAAIQELPLYRETEPLAVGDFVKLHTVTGVYLRRITQIFTAAYSTSGPVTLYALENPEKRVEYATRQCIENNQ